MFGSVFAFQHQTYLFTNNNSMKLEMIFLVLYVLLYLHIMNRESPLDFLRLSKYLALKFYVEIHLESLCIQYCCYYELWSS